MATSIDQRKKPTSVKIHVSNNAGVDISWADGHASHYDFPYLRDECPCATCNEKRDQERNQTAPAILAPSPLLPMFKPKARAQAATSVGNYAIQITFSDGHATGIYSYDQLRTICPCEECAKTFRAAGA
ncbi:MAG TPA: DUF971 domain-containing protein [Candidatus Saccharimonadales bacterium]|nr:DUF971 domain-containing protein [Candidatus Saccharimonadales bacterium]